jgi:hypothetical protein
VTREIREERIQKRTAKRREKYVKYFDENSNSISSGSRIQRNFSNRMQ